MKSLSVRTTGYVGSDLPRHHSCQVSKTWRSPTVSRLAYPGRILRRHCSSRNARSQHPGWPQPPAARFAACARPASTRRCRLFFQSMPAISRRKSIYTAGCRRYLRAGVSCLSARGVCNERDWYYFPGMRLSQKVAGETEAEAGHCLRQVYLTPKKEEGSAFSTLPCAAAPLVSGSAEPGDAGL
jgi:hypothetical protein